MGKRVPLTVSNRPEVFAASEHRREKGPGEFTRPVGDPLISPCLARTWLQRPHDHTPRIKTGVTNFSPAVNAGPAPAM